MIDLPFHAVDRFLALPDHAAQNPLDDRLHVAAPLPQILILNPGEELLEFPEGPLQGRLGVDPFRLDEPDGLADQHAVPEYQEVGVDHVEMLRAALSCKFLLQRPEFLLRRGEGLLKRSTSAGTSAGGISVSTTATRLRSVILTWPMAMPGDAPIPCSSLLFIFPKSIVDQFPQQWTLPPPRLLPRSSAD